MVQISQRVRTPLLGRLDRVETLDEHFVEIQTASGAIAPPVVHALKLILARRCGNYRCVAYYRRGHGRSELAPYGYSLRNQMLDLAGLLDHVEVRQAVIVAVAMATTIASYALEYPDRVKGLVLASWYELDGYPLMERRRSKKYKTTFAELHMQMFEIIRDHGQQGLIDHMIRKETHSFLFSRRTQQCGRKS